MTEQIANFGHTTLAEGLDDTEIGVDVTDGSVFPATGDFRVKVENELMLVTARSSNTLTVTRGIEGTTAASHAIDLAIDAVLTAAGLTTMIEEASALPTARAKRTSGSLTLNSTSWANVDTGLDLTSAASAGDVLEVSLSALWSNDAVNGYLDAATIVSAAPVNYIGGTGGATERGVSGWHGNASVNFPIGASVQYVVQAGDISGGNVVLRLRYRTSAASNRTLFGTADIPLAWSVVNLGQ